MLLHFGVEDIKRVLEVGVEQPHKVGNYILRYFEDKVPQTNHGEGLKKFHFLKSFVQVARFKYFSIGVVSNVVGFLFLC